MTISEYWNLIHSLWICSIVLYQNRVTFWPYNQMICLANSRCVFYMYTYNKAGLICIFFAVCQTLIFTLKPCTVAQMSSKLSQLSLGAWVIVSSFVREWLYITKLKSDFPNMRRTARFRIRIPTHTTIALRLSTYDKVIYSRIEKKQFTIEDIGLPKMKSYFKSHK